MRAHADDEWYGNQDANGGGDPVALEPYGVPSGNGMQTWLASINTAELGRQLIEAANTMMSELNTAANQEAMNQVQETLGSIDSARISLAALHLPAGCQFTKEQIGAALDKIERTLPQYYKDSIRHCVLDFNNLSGSVTGNSLGIRDATGQIIGGIIQINPGATPGLSAFSGSKEDFLAAVMIHESHHVYYATIMEPEALRTTRATEEASVRYWTETWAYENGISQVAPNSRGTDGKPDYNMILDEVKSTKDAN
jgi:hypothetical protein